MLDNSTGWYGMGWYIEGQGQDKVVSHSGLVPDFFAYMALLPEQRKGVILLVNMDHFTMQITMSEVDAGLTRLLAGKPPAPLRMAAIPWVQRGLLLIPILQIIDVACTLGLLRRRRNKPENQRPGLTVGDTDCLPLHLELARGSDPDPGFSIKRLFDALRP